jgi:hypothetical protein
VSCLTAAPHLYYFVDRLTRYSVAHCLTDITTSLRLLPSYVERGKVLIFDVGIKKETITLLYTQRTAAVSRLESMQI